ncbi:MAG: tRNA (adenosine(37)-N6)-dimethylallyltransferase MiaA [Acidobacteriaceae bacterium]
MAPDLTAPAPLLCVLVGPTASGKTALSIAVACRLHGEIVNCDSVAVYRDFDIGTAKPNADERQQAPHHLFDIVDPDEHFTAGDYARKARAVIAEVSQRGNLPIVVGGTGLYLRALLDGLFAGPERSENLRTRLREAEHRNGPGLLHRLLKRLDDRAASSIHPNDIPKLIRAVEVCLSARTSISDIWKRGTEPLVGFRIVKLGLAPERTTLYARINARCVHMFERGLVAETEALVAKWGPDTRPLQSLGYRQAFQLLRGMISEETMISSTQQGHRNYAKRQLTWFRRERDVHWLPGFGDDPQIQSQALDLLSNQADARAPEPR